MPLILHNKALQVTIDKPGEVYQSSRFDWTGQVNQVVLNNKYTFCTTEIADGSQLSAKGIGMCNEFGIATPVGYDDCSVGDVFPKIGVGLLSKQTDEPYNFYKPYQVIPAKTHTDQLSDNKVIIKSDIEQNNGYSYILEKIFEIANNQLVIKYALTNNGIKPIITEEYCHNFIAINKLPVNSDYKLILPVNVKIDTLTEVVSPNNCLNINSNIISWNNTPESDFFLTDLNFGHNRINTWNIENSQAGVGIKETCNFKPAQCNLWGKGHVISPEIFIHLSLKPGETKTWERKFEFYTL